MINSGSCADLLLFRLVEVVNVVALTRRQSF